MPEVSMPAFAGVPISTDNRMPRNVAALVGGGKIMVIRLG